VSYVCLFLSKITVNAMHKFIRILYHERIHYILVTNFWKFFHCRTFQETCKKRHHYSFHQISGTELEIEVYKNVIKASYFNNNSQVNKIV